MYYEEMENVIYNMSDLMLILRTYCTKHKEDNDKIRFVDEILGNMLKELDKITTKFVQ